ncbi:hypothetical protein BRARA_E00066 [Brassica rapa]|uniref:Uncharacterized protein n=1 Tax=Brassica campestris TaxID=3711 RepID=A0A397Z5T1_BRACM|nr:hypothetical protein BRARA_E00066 [Brassica rapa]
MSGGESKQTKKLLSSNFLLIMTPVHHPSLRTTPAYSSSGGTGRRSLCWTASVRGDEPSSKNPKKNQKSRPFLKIYKEENNSYTECETSYIALTVNKDRTSLLSTSSVKAPSLVYLDYSSHVFMDYRFVDLDSLAEVRLKPKLWDHHKKPNKPIFGDVTNLAAGIRNITTLHLSPDSLEGLVHRVTQSQISAEMQRRRRVR